MSKDSTCRTFRRGEHAVGGARSVLDEVLSEARRMLQAMVEIEVEDYLP